MRLPLTPTLAVLSFLFCASVALSATGSSLDGVRVHPDAPAVDAADWWIELQRGEENGWKVEHRLRTDRYLVSRLDHARALEARLRGLLAREGTLPKGAAKSADEMLRLLGALYREPGLYTRDAQDIYLHLREVSAAFNYNFLYPLNQDIYDVLAGFWLFGKITNRIGDTPRGPAVNEPAGADPSFVDPVESSFWTRRGPIAQADLRNGFGRGDRPFELRDCEYDEAKSSYGTHGGFTLKCGGSKYKMKFGDEARAEPFNARVVWALGFHATPVDYIREGTLVRYDRRVLTEYNLRKELSIRVRSLFGFTWFKIPFQRTLDPFADAVAGAVLDDGRFVDSASLKLLLLGADRSPEEISNAAFYHPAAEATVRHLVLREGSVESEVKGEKSLGAWSWSDFDHPNRREYRAFGALTAWLGIFDIRRDNNRLRLFEGKDGRRELRHYVSDLGSLLGCRVGTEFCGIISRLNVFSDQMVTAKAPAANAESFEGAEGLPFEFLNYVTWERSAAFARMSLNDARWMARRIGQLSREQLRAGLLVSGYGPAEAEELSRKLARRRDSLLEACGLPRVQD